MFVWSIWLQKQINILDHFGFSGPQAASFEYRSGIMQIQPCQNGIPKQPIRSKATLVAPRPTREKHNLGLWSQQYPVDSGPPTEGKGGSLVVPIL